MQVINRDYFMALYEKINNDFLYNHSDYSVYPTITVSANSFLLDIKEKVLNQLKFNGFVIVDFNTVLHHEMILEILTNTFALPCEDSANLGTPYSKISAEKDSKYFANTCYTQPLHTDDAHVLTTPRTIALYCEKQSNDGGLTTLIQFDEIYNKLNLADHPYILDCFEEEAFVLDGVKGQIKRPFFYKLEDRLIGCIFPAFLMRLSAKQEILAIYKQIMDFAHSASNQIRFKLHPGQLLLIDNYRVFHGRTKFNFEDERVLYRYCFEKMLS